MILFDEVKHGEKGRAGIYAIINLINDKAYVGSSVNLGRRISSHRRELSRSEHANDKLQKAWNRHGEKNFKIVVLEFIESGLKEDIISREQYYIDNYRSADRELGYNLRPIADSQLGRHRSEQDKKNISEKLKGRIKTPEEIEKLRKTKTGVPWSPKLREARTKSNWKISGENAPKSKLTEVEVREILRKHNEEGIGCRRLAKEYGVGRTAILNIFHRRSWKHLEV